jgi:biofilm PGA synthesis lipoprotein PgaB
MRLVLVLAAFLFLSPASGAAAGEFLALCFHDVRQQADGRDDLTMTTDKFVALLSWLRGHDYRPVSVDDLLAARKGEKELPEKAVLLTFDDGYRGFYTEVFPLLKAFNYPAVLALVGTWMEAAAGGPVAYGDRQVPREHFLSWQQVRELSASGLVEIASHSFDLHHGLPGNPQGNLEPALSVCRYDPGTGNYESEGAYLARLRADLLANADLIERRIGRRPRVMVWPYGKYNCPALEIAEEAGMSIAFRLEGGLSRTDDLQAVNRILLEGSLPLPDLVWRILHPGKQDPKRVVHVDLDYLYDPDPQQAERNLDQLLDRIKSLQINTVYLQAFADPDADGAADALYFPNRFLPMRADLFNRVAWQLMNRCEVEVYAWLPVLAFVVGEEDLQVRTWMAETGTAALDPRAYRRLSPFSPEARQLVTGIYEDLARHADFSGLLFHDDAVLSDFEDAHPQALAWLRNQGLPDDISELRQDPELLCRWTRLKTEYLIDFTLQLTDCVRTWRPAVKTARNLYARPVLEPESESWFAQSLPLFLEAYDYAALMAMPYMEQAADPERWLTDLVGAIARQPKGLQKTVFELQSVDWRRNLTPVATTELVAQMRLLQRLGALNFGYYPDNFLEDRPQRDRLHTGLSLATYPYRAR